MSAENDGLREIYAYRMPEWSRNLLRYLTRCLYEGLLESNQLIPGESIRVEKGMQAARQDLAGIQEFLASLGRLRHDIDLGRQETRASEQAEHAADLLRTVLGALDATPGEK